VARILPWYLLAVIGMAGGNVTARVFYALKDTQTLSYVAFGEVLLYAAYAPPLAARFGAVGMAGAMAIYYCVSLAVQALILGRRLHLRESKAFFAALGDLIITGPTDTNVGDLQVLLIG